MSAISENNRHVIKNIIGAFAVKGSSLVISVVLLPLYLGFFKSQEILGIWYTILSVLNWVILFDLGLGQGLRNQLPKALARNDRKLAHEYISTTYILMGVIAVIVTILGVNLIKHIDLYSIFNTNQEIIAYSYLEKSTIIVFWGIMLQLVLKIVTSILYAIQKSAVVNLLAFLTNVVILIALMIAPSYDIGENLLVMSWVNVFATNLPYIICSFVLFQTKELKGLAPAIKGFCYRYIKEIFNVGISLMWLQVVFMIISSTNEFLITILTAPEFVVEYQTYYKIFKTAAMVVSLALTPIWSAVTKAQIEKNYKWIKNVYVVFLGIAVVFFVGELCLIPVLQWGMDIWMGEGFICVKVSYAIVFALSSLMFILHSINTSIGNGLSFFKIQIIFMTFAAVVFIPLAVVCARIFNSWIGVVLASVISMLPYEVLAPFFTFKFINCIIKGEEKK